MGALFFWSFFFLIQDIWNTGYPETQRYNYLCLPSAEHILTLSPDQVILKSHIIMYFHLLLNNIQTFIHHRTDPLYLGLGNYHINFRALLSPWPSAQQWSVCFYGFVYSRHGTPKPSVASVNLLGHFQGFLMFLLKYVLCFFLWTKVQGRTLPHIHLFITYSGWFHAQFHGQVFPVLTGAPEWKCWVEVILSALLSNCTIWHAYQQQMRVPSAISAPTTVTVILLSWRATSLCLNLHFLTASSYVLMEKHLFSYLSHL